jgi:hypothetical protein
MNRAGVREAAIFSGPSPRKNVDPYSETSVRFARIFWRRRRRALCSGRRLAGRGSRRPAGTPAAIHERLASVKSIPSCPASVAKPPARAAQRAGQHSLNVPARLPTTARPCTGIGLVLSNGPAIHSGWPWTHNLTASTRPMISSGAGGPCTWRSEVDYPTAIIAASGWPVPGRDFWDLPLRRR